MNRVLVKHLEKGGCSGFLIKYVYRISLRYMAISIHEDSRAFKSTKSTRGVSTYMPHSGIHVESGLIRKRLEPDHATELATNITNARKCKGHS